MKRISQKASWLVLLATLTTGCTTLDYWFTDDEELEVRVLEPIEEQFEVEEVWDTSVGDGVGKFFSRLKPVQHDGILYIADRHGYLEAIDGKDGDRIWRLDLAKYPDEGWFSGIDKLISRGETARLASLSHVGGKLFLGSENGTFYAIDPKDGNILWQTSVPGEILAPATLDSGIVVINTGSGSLFAFDETSGEQLWRSESEVPPLSLRGISAPVAANGGVIVGTPAGYLKVSVLDTGLTAWETAIAKPTGATELERIVDIDATPIIFGGLVYTIAYNGTLAAVELRSGRIVWKREYGSFRDISLSGNTLYVVDINSNVLALDRRNGIERWSQSSIKGRSLTAAVPFGDYVVVGDSYGILHWLDEDDGRIVSRYDLGGDDKGESIFGDPVVLNDTLIAITRTGEISALKPKLNN